MFGNLSLFHASFFNASRIHPTLPCKGQISPTFYKQLLQKRQKDSQVKQLFLLKGSARIKATCKFDPGVNFINILCAAFGPVDLYCFLVYGVELRTRKLCIHSSCEHC